MDISYFWFFAFSIVILLAILRHIKIGNYQPEKVLLDLGENVCVNYSALGTKSISKNSIVKIQFAGNTVTLFNKSDNALDIHIPRRLWAKKIFNRAQDVFPHAQVV